MCRRFEDSLVFGVPIVASCGFAQLPHDRRGVCPAAHVVPRGAVRDDQTISGAEDGLQERVSILVSLVAVAEVVFGSRPIKARPVVGSWERVLAHPHEAHHPKRNRAQRDELGQGDAASKEANRRRFSYEELSELSPQRLQLDLALVSCATGGVLKVAEGGTQGPRGRAGLIFFREELADEMPERTDPVVYREGVPGSRVEIEKDSA